jgi:hypothetical protein
LGASMYGSLLGLLEDGSIKVCLARLYLADAIF